MTTRFRIDAVALDTTEGAARYEFPSDLTVLAGPTGVGKTTLLELVKYGLGCDGKLAPVALDHVNDVTVETTVGSARLRISRSIDPRKQATARVTDLITGERLSDHYVDGGQPSLNTLLMTALDLPDDMRAAARTMGSSNAGARISFADVFSFLYVPQSDINRDIANSQESYREPKRKAVFELLFGLTSPRVLMMRSDLNAFNAKITAAETEYQTVLDFLRDSNTTSRAEAEQAMAAAAAGQAAAEAEHAMLREGIDPVTDRDTLALRDLLTEAERALADARATVTALARQQADYTSERRRVQTDLDRFHRMRDAGERLASIEFTVCPRCLQPLTHRPVPEGSCRVCLQPDPVAAAAAGDTDLYEARQLADQLAEMDDQLHALSGQLAAAAQAVTDREQLVKGLSADLDAHRRPHHPAPASLQRRRAAPGHRPRPATGTRTGTAPVGPRRRHRRGSTPATRRPGEPARGAGQRRGEPEQPPGRGPGQPHRRVPGHRHGPGHPRRAVRDHPPHQLPAAAQRPAIRHLQPRRRHHHRRPGRLLDLPARRGAAPRRHPYPALLIIDSPRLALNAAEDLSAALYRRLVTMADASPGQVQFLIADNQLPAHYRRDKAQIDFTYDTPTISTVHHPGPANVRPITLDEPDR